MEAILITIAIILIIFGLPLAYLRREAKKTKLTEKALKKTEYPGTGCSPM